MSADGDGRERADDEVDAAWADIIARLGPLGDPEPDAPGDPAPGLREGRGEGRGEGQESGDGSGGHQGAGAAATSWVAPRPAGPRDHVPSPEEDGDEGHFVPDDPAPLRGVGLAWWAPWLALVGAPVLLGVVALARGSVPAWLLLAAVVAFTGGAVAAVLRLPARTDDGGDGAVL